MAIKEVLARLRAEEQPVARLPERGASPIQRARIRQISEKINPTIIKDYEKIKKRELDTKKLKRVLEQRVSYEQIIKTKKKESKKGNVFFK